MRTSDNKFIVARDPYGVRPLYVLHYIDLFYIPNTPIYAFASELKVLNKIELNKISIQQFKPGTYTTSELFIHFWTDSLFITTFSIS